MYLRGKQYIRQVLKNQGWSKGDLNKYPLVEEVKEQQLNINRL